MNEDLLIKYLLKEVTATEQKVVEQWLIEKPGNQRKLEQLRLIWETSKTLIPVKETDENRAWEHFKQKKDLRSRKITPIRKRNNFLKIAAVIVAVLSIGFWFYTNRQNSQQSFTAQNEVRTETLPDGSVLILNKNSKLSFSVGENQRLVKFETGEVFFDVALDKNNPFIINIAGNLTIQVVGTSFNVKHREGKTEIIVETGLVKVSKNNNEIYLQAGEKLESNEQSQQLTKHQNTDKLYRYYRDKEFNIDNIPLERVANILSEAYDIRITIKQEEVKKMTLNTKFKDETPEQILNVIVETFNLKVIKKDKEFILTKENE